MKSKIRYFIYYPLILAFVLVAGIFIGKQLSMYQHINQAFFSQMHKKGSSEKIDNLLRYIEEAYVDSIDLDSLSEKVVSEILAQLDPHSGYIPAHAFEEINADMHGNFEGIGVEFNILNDTITVVSPIAGGPSEMLGILPGDRIVKVEGENVAGIKIKNEDVIKRLRGKKGTTVKVSIKRNGLKQLIDFKITRDAIPIYSVETAYMIDDEIGLIKISRFAANTYEEYIDAFKKLKNKGLKKLILDLRGNPGGYLTAATKLADEFLKNGQMIVYTQGKSQPKEEFLATSKGMFENNPIVVLIDEGSASASEIIAGAIQDNDRGTIIGRRTFGKGLVQEQNEFGDGSALRLTVARYYTPTGRCIQKPYKIGNANDYFEEEIERYENGELYHADSIKFDEKQKFTTPKGKVVYGGGGIMPDVFVPLDTSARDKFLSEIYFNGLVNKFAISYTDKHRKELSKFKSASAFINEFECTENLYSAFLDFVKKEKVKTSSPSKTETVKLLKTQIKALIGRALFKNEVFYPVIYADDKAVLKAVEILKNKVNS